MHGDPYNRRRFLAAQEGRVRTCSPGAACRPSAARTGCRFILPQIAELGVEREGAALCDRQPRRVEPISRIPRWVTASSNAPKRSSRSKAGTVPRDPALSGRPEAVFERDPVPAGLARRLGVRTPAREVLRRSTRRSHPGAPGQCRRLPARATPSEAGTRPLRTRGDSSAASIRRASASDFIGKERKKSSRVSTGCATRTFGGPLRRPWRRRRSWRAWRRDHRDQHVRARRARRAFGPVGRLGVLADDHVGEGARAEHRVVAAGRAGSGASRGRRARDPAGHAPGQRLGPGPRIDALRVVRD